VIILNYWKDKLNQEQNAYIEKTLLNFKLTEPILSVTDQNNKIDGLYFIGFSKELNKSKYIAFTFTNEKEFYHDLINEIPLVLIIGLDMSQYSLEKHVTKYKLNNF
jgi:hypothetical protein